MKIQEVYLTNENLVKANQVLLTSINHKSQQPQVIIEFLAKLPIDATERGNLLKLKSFMQNYAAYLQDTCDKEGWSLLHIAAYQGHTSIVALLLEYQFNTRCKNLAGWQPLHCAAYKGHYGIIKLLLAKQAPINEADNDGWTPLHCAAYKGHKLAIKFLLAYGANANACNKEKLTPSELALTHHKMDIPQFIAYEVDINNFFARQLTKQSMQACISYKLSWFKQAQTIVFQKILIPFQIKLVPK